MFIQKICIPTSDEVIIEQELDEACDNMLS